MSGIDFLSIDLAVPQVLAKAHINESPTISQNSLRGNCQWKGEDYSIACCIVIIFPILIPIIKPPILLLITSTRDSKIKTLIRTFLEHPKLHITEISFDWSKMLAVILELSEKKHRHIEITTIAENILSIDCTFSSKFC